MAIRTHTTTGIGSGTGTIIRSDGYVLTNFHVLVDPTSKELSDLIIVYLKPKTLTGDADRDLTIPALGVLIGASGPYDLALLRLCDPLTRKPMTGLPWLSLSPRENVGIGEPVYAIGHPSGGQLWTQTPGEVGAFAREFRKVTGYGVYQHSASVNPGNSGGPLLDARGQQIGINTFIVRQSIETGMTLIGLNYAVTSATARRWLEFHAGPDFLPSAGPMRSEGLTPFAPEPQMDARGQSGTPDALTARQINY